MVRRRTLFAFSSLCLAMPACLDRPVVSAIPKTHAVHSERIRQNSVNKIDLLFMIDNSASMADKQEVLAEAVPDLLDRLINPACVRFEGDREIRMDKLPNGKCPEGSELEFQPIKDIHIGVISSSLGGNGSSWCKVDNAPSNDDRAHLLSRKKDGTVIPTYADKGRREREDRQHGDRHPHVRGQGLSAVGSGRQARPQGHFRSGRAEQCLQRHGPRCQPTRMRL